MDYTEHLKKAADVVIEHERACDCCTYKDNGCDGSGGVRGGPNGPIYPPCCDHDPLSYMDQDLIAEVYDEIMEGEQ